MAIGVFSIPVGYIGPFIAFDVRLQGIGGGSTRPTEGKMFPRGK